MSNNSVGFNRREYMRQYSNDRHHWLIAHKMCRCCATQDERTLAGYTQCKVCAEKRKEEARRRQARQFEQNKGKPLQNGICVSCNKQPRMMLRKKDGEQYQICEDCYKRMVKGWEQAQETKKRQMEEALKEYNERRSKRENKT